MHRALSRLGIRVYLQAWRYKKIQRSFDKESRKFKDIYKLSQLIKTIYGEDVYDELSQKRIYFYMEKYEKSIESMKVHLKSKMILKLNNDCDDSVFTMWWQGYDSTPAVVRACIQSLQKLGRKVIVLTESNIHDYIWLPDYVWEKYADGKIGEAHFADIVKLSALAMYGGLWADATVYIADTVPNYMMKKFFVFKQSSQLKECRHYSNWWIAAAAGHELIIAELSYLLTYWKYEDAAMDNNIFHIFFRKIIDNNEQYKRICEMMPTRITDQAYMLVKNYDNEYDWLQWEEMKKISPVFKCTYEMNGLSSYNTYFCRLCNGELG